MYQVDINVSSLVASLGKDAETVMEKAVDALGEFALDRLRQEAAAKLSRDNQDVFANALKVTRGQNSIQITLDDKKAESIEEGIQPFDMKPLLLSSKNVKQGKNGPYIDIPFAHKTTSQGKGLQVPDDMKNTVRRAMRDAADSGQAQRIFRSGKGAARTKQSDMKVTPDRQATTIRRISQNSDPKSWMHPGTKGIGAFTKVASEVVSIQTKVIEDLIKAVIKP